MGEKLVIENLHKAFAGNEVLKGISFSVQEGEFLSILGPSGCGKTTLLRILIGIESVDAGKILKDTKEITHLPPAERGMGIVFQNYALFPNMTVLQNVMYALKIQKATRGQAKEIALDILDKVGLTAQLDLKPHKLSGGQQQRVAIARTLALNPDIVLFDEPMSALDVTNRVMLRKEIKQVQEKFGITMIYITHDQEEAFSMSDRIMVMRQGNIEQLDTPKEIYAHPKNSYVAEFVVDQLQEKITSIQQSAGIMS